MKKQKLLKNLRHRLSLLLCLMAFLAVGQGAWGTTYYLYGSTSEDNPANWNKTYAESTSYTFHFEAPSGNNFLAICTSKSASGIISTSGKTFEKNSTNVGSFEHKEWGGFHYIFLSMKSTSNVVLTYDGSSKYIISDDVTATAPTVRLGEKPEETGSYDVNVSAYVAATGCADISKFTVYYSKNAITNKGASGVYSKEFTQSPAPTLGSTTTLTLPSADLATNGWSTGGDLYIRITGTNSAGESELSDEIKLNYTVCAGIITSLVINPSSTQLTVNTPQTFTYTANDGATVDNVEWYKNEVQVSTDNSYTFTPTTGASFTIGLKAYNNTCNPTGFDAEPQTYTVCVPTTAVQITNCPVNPERGTPITFTATGIGGTPAEWVWTVNGEVQQEITVEGNTSSITYTPQTATTYTVVATASSCDGTEPSAQCVFVVLKSFTATDLEKEFSACAGGHQFAWSEMFTPTPDSWSAVETTGGADATALFTLNNGVMIWNNDGKTDGTYEYTFTAVKEGYKNATADITITYTAASTPSGTIGEITITPEDNPTYPWTKVELSCPINVTGSDIDHVVWSCSNSGLVVSTGVAEGTATAYFKGKNVRKDTDYTITAVGQNESCGSTEPKTMVIKVQPEEEEVCY